MFTPIVGRTVLVPGGTKGIGKGIARALANRPALLLADEPTGELDEATGEQIADLFDRVHADGTAIVVVTHNPVVAARAGRRLAMKSGMVVAG